MYRHARVERRNEVACRIIETLFNAFLDDEEHMSVHARSRIKEESRHRVVCDYIAGMTDRYALSKHAELLGQTDSDLL